MYDTMDPVKGNLSSYNYWKKKLAGGIDPTNIKLDFSRNGTSSGNCQKINCEISSELSGRIFDLSGNEPFLVYTILSTVLNICLFKYTGYSEIVTGTPSLNTGNSHFTYGLPVTAKIDEKMKFKELLLGIKDILLETYENQDCGIDLITGELGIEKNDGRNHLFDIVVSLSGIHNQLDNVKTDMKLDFKADDKKLNLEISFREDIYRNDTIVQFAGRFLSVLQKTVFSPNITIKDISLMTDSEKDEILNVLNDTATPYPSNKCIHQLFEEIVMKYPDKTALVYGDERLTFDVLNRKANYLANYLIKKGVKPNMPVGLFIERSVEMIVGLLAVLKSGGAYVPIDTNYPKERIITMIEAAKFGLIITKSGLKDKLPENKSGLILIDKDWPVISDAGYTNPENVVSVNDLCYIIFTSGSTGVPKGAAVYHKGWTNLLHWFTKEFKIDENDRNLIISSFSFDITQRAIAMSLINGGELHLLKSDFYDPGLIVANIQKERITLTNCSPSTFYPVIEDNESNYERIRTLRWLFLGGEAISASRLFRWAGSEKCNTHIANVYGAAECTDVSSFYILKNFNDYIRSSVLIGKLIYNTQIYILDENLSPVAKGLVGEICIAGDGVGKGYINDDNLTASKFIDNPFNKGTKLYKTGDIGRYLPDGNLEFAGRVDHQVKVRGFRIDLGDIESVIRQNQMIKEAVVIDMIFPPNDHRIIAYIVPEVFENTTRNDDGFIEEIRSYAKDKLPAYMIPNIFMMIKKLPLNPNGKVDRKALPVPEIITTTNECNERNGASNDLETKILSAFKETLKVEKIKPEDNFFDLGGHSLLATQLVSFISEKYGIKLSPADLLASPSVAGLITRIEKKGLNKNG